MSLNLRLTKWAKRLRVPDQDIDDLVCATVTDTIELGAPLAWHYCSVVLKNNWLRIRRDRIRRNDVPSLDIWNPDETYNVRLTTNADQEKSILSQRVIQEIESFNSPNREVAEMICLEYEPDEIAARLDMEKKEVYWRCQMVRNKLREKFVGEPVGKRGHPTFHGIRKDCRKWVAAFRHGKEYFHLGYFHTAEKAARAYDKKAFAVLGERAHLNFPRIEATPQPSIITSAG